MQHYPVYIKKANSFTDEEWERLYFTNGKTYGRTPCKIEHGEKYGNGCSPVDNMKPNNLVFENKGVLCDGCRVLEVKDFFGSGQPRKVVNCKPEQVLLRGNKTRVMQI